MVGHDMAVIVLLYQVGWKVVMVLLCVFDVATPTHSQVSVMNMVNKLLSNPIGKMLKEIHTSLGNL